MTPHPPSPQGQDVRTQLRVIVSEWLRSRPASKGGDIYEQLIDAIIASGLLAGRELVEALRATRAAVRNTTYPEHHPIWHAAKLCDQALSAYDTSHTGKETM